MDLSIASAVVTLQPGRVLRIQGGAGRRISHVGGAVWVTQDGDTRDIVLENGADLVLAGGGRAVLQALGGPALIAFEDGVEIEHPAPQPRFEVLPYTDHEAEARRLRAEAIAALLARAGAATKRFWKRAGKRIQAARARHELRELSDYQLRDIGLRRTEIDCLTC